MVPRSLPAIFRRRNRQASQPVVPTASADARRFSKAGEGTKDLVEGYNAWTSGLAKHALQVGFALIGANWALYGTQAGILSNGWATASLFVAIGYLVLQLVLMQLMCMLHKRQHDYAEHDRDRWANEYDAAANTKSDWPFTRSIIRLGKVMTWLNVCAPVLSGALLFASVFFGASVAKSAVQVPVSNIFNVTNSSSTEKLGTISGFSLGDASVPMATASNADVIVEITRRWLSRAAQGGKSSLVIVGSADRVPLVDDSLRRFESNFGLASSRADAVKRAILQECLRQDSACSLRADQMIVLASGPVLTHAPWLKHGMGAGYADDRRVDVWALWSTGG